MDNRQQAKSAVLAYFSDLESARPEELVTVLKTYVSDGYYFRGVHPFNEIDNAAEVATAVWRPLAESFTALQRRQDIFMAGTNLIASDMWVTSMGTFMGLFDKPWLGIRPTRKIAMIPYCEFHRIEDGKITESALWLDIISVMKTVWIQPVWRANRCRNSESRSAHCGRRFAQGTRRRGIR